MSEFLKVVQAVKTANSALSQWQKIEFEGRVSRLAELPNVVRDSRATLLQSFSNETGASALYNLDFEVALAQLDLFFSSHAELINDSDCGFLPVGLIGLITGSKNLFSTTLLRIVISLAMGNAVIWKASEKVKVTSKQISDLFLRLNLPGPGLLNLVDGESHEISEALVDHPAIHQVMFVGSSEVGKLIYARAGQNGKRIQASMGARNPAIIFGDVNLDEKTDQLVQALFDHHGLGRWRASRIFVQETIYKEFLERLKVYISSSEPKYLGTLHESMFKRFTGAINQAVDEKGKRLIDSQNFKPQVIYDLTNCSTLQQEEIEGPLITISSFKYQFDAIKFANTSPLGKVAFVWAGDNEKAKKAAKKLEVGRVFINEVPKTFVSKRFQAAKESGVGAEGIFDLIEFCSYRVNVT